jgi:hypothetical protein
MALSRITEAVASFTDLTIADDLTLSDDLLMASDAAKISFGADADVSFTHVADTGLLLNSTSVIQFNDASQNIGAPSATVLDINATDEIELNATLIDVNGNLDISGTIVGASTISGTTITAATAFVPDASDGAALGTTALEFSDLFLADGAVISLGDDDDVTLTHVADTGILLNSTSVIQFNDASQSIGAPSATELEIKATDEIELTSTLIDVVGRLAVSGNISGSIITGTQIEIGSAVITEAELELLDGITAGTAAANKAVVLDGSKNIATIGTIGSGAITSSGTIQGTTITATTAFVPDASDGAALGTSALEFSDLFLADASTIQFGADQDVTLTHVADTGLLLNTTMKLQFRDAAIHISSTADGDLSIAADDEIDLTSTLIDINGNATVSGTLGVTGIATFTDDIIIGDGKTIGSASDVDAITIASNGQLTLTQTLIGTALDISGDIDVDGTTNLDVVDIDGAVDMATTLAVGGVVTANAGVVVDTITIDAGEIDQSSGDLTLDVAGDLIIDTDGAEIKLKDGGTLYAKLHNHNPGNAATSLIVESSVQDQDILLKGNDGGAVITALALDMSAGGAATLNNGLTLTDGNLVVANGHGIDFGATGNISGTSQELLDDYEEGSWTPTLGGNANYTQQFGRYTKIGNSITLQCVIIVGNAIGTGSASVLQGLPFAQESTGFSVGSLSISYMGANAVSVIYPTGYVTNNAATIAFSGMNGSNTTFQLNGFNMFGNGTHLQFSVTYRTA